MFQRSLGQILFASALLVGNTIYASQILQMSRPFETGEPGPSFLPVILCAFVYIAGISILAAEWRRPSRAESNREAGSDFVPFVHILGPTIAICLSALFIVGFFYLGYLLSALIYTALIAAYFTYEQSGNSRRALLSGLMIGGCVTLFGWLFFVELFALYLPLWEL